MLSCHLVILLKWQLTKTNLSNKWNQCPLPSLKDSWNIILKDAGGAKIQVIKVLREFTGQGLKEVKDMTDKVPATVKEGVKKAEAEEIKKKLEEAGATVELK